MSLFEIIGSILIGPLKLLFELIFSVATKAIAKPGPAIVVLSLAMNILVLPLYRRADAIQIEARDTENKLKDVVTHIKKTFSGDERMMILQTYYRQNNYNPLSVLSGSISLLLEIPFFMAAYQFLSNVNAFYGTPFGPIPDLSKPDGLLVVGSITINLLPVLMTLINVVSSSLYLKGFPLKTKIQLYGMALFFLVFLYNSPSALVLYWTLNNTFSLLKTLYYRIKNSRIILNILLGVGGAFLIVYSKNMPNFLRTALLVCVGLAAQLPWIVPLLMKKIPFLRRQDQTVTPNTTMFILGGVFLTVLVGLLIPSTYVSASPQEFIDVHAFYNPAWYVVYTLCLSAGTFLVWLGVFYWLAKPAVKVFFSWAVWILGIIMLVNYMFFGTNLGVLSPDLVYTDGFSFPVKEHLINIAVVLVLLVALYLVVRKFPRAVTTVLLVGSIALTCMGGLNVIRITRVAAETRQQLDASSDEHPTFTMSQNGQNVVVIMLDRAIGPYIPYLMEENPTLVEQFDGFTYYPQTISYGCSTNFGSPPLYGGYEYIPTHMNLRDSMLLEEKHNEALKVVPTVFAEEGYKVTVMEPSYAGYEWIPDLSIYDDLPDVHAYHVDGAFMDDESRAQTIEARKRNFFLFSVMKTMPVSVQSPIYNRGKYLAVGGNNISSVDQNFLNEYNTLQNMATMTEITSGDERTYMFLRSDITHEPVELQEPNYEPSATVNNRPFYAKGKKVITDGISSYVLTRQGSLKHYHVNMAAMILLGNWFDYLRENGLYDNTRIILVSDHGTHNGLLDETDDLTTDIDYYLPLLMVKDFNAKGFTTSDAFMTNADVPTLSFEGLVESPVNPYTGNPINSSYKEEHAQQHVILSHDWQIKKNNGYQFLPSEWATVSGDVRNKDNWTFHMERTIFPPNFVQ